jgi:hypothetical protein
VYADFVMSASHLLLNAHILDDIALNGDEQRLVGLMNRMRLFAPQEVLVCADAVLKTILDTYLKPRVELRQLVIEALAEGSRATHFYHSVWSADTIWTKSAIPWREQCARSTNPLNGELRHSVLPAAKPLTGGIGGASLVPARP